MSGTELGYGSGLSEGMELWHARYCASVWSYGMRGTELAYGPDDRDHGQGRAVHQRDGPHSIAYALFGTDMPYTMLSPYALF
eukprot:3511391-Rhodomonas_salina.4